MNATTGLLPASRLFFIQLYCQNRQKRMTLFVLFVHSSKKNKNAFFMQKKSEKDLTFGGKECIIGA